MSDSHDKNNVFRSGIIRKTEYFDLFISYKRDNGGDHGQKLAEELYSKLTADGYKVWLDNEEIGFSSDFEKRLEEAILHSKKVACVISPAWVESENCRFEHKKAVEFEKRLIPIHYKEFRSLLSAKKDEGLLSEYEWRKLDKPQEVDFSAPEKAEKGYADLKAVCDLKDETTSLHTKILTEAYYWQSFNQPKSMLRTGEALAQSRTLKAKCDGDAELPTFSALQNEFLEASQEFTSSFVSNRRAAFIIYNKEDEGFASDLNMELRLNNVTTFFHESLHQNTDVALVEDEIIKSDNVVRILGKQSEQQEHEFITFAQSKNKRILGISNSKERVKALKSDGAKNIFYWSEDARIDGLISTINGDKAYNVMHTKLLSASYEWESSGENDSYFLNYKDAKMYQEWYKLAEDTGTEPQPNVGMISFVERSLTYADAQKKKRRLLIWFFVFVAIIMGVLAWASFKFNSDRNEAESKAKIAEKKELQAIAQEKASLANAEKEREKANTAIEEGEEAQILADQAKVALKAAELLAEEANARAQEALGKEAEAERLASEAKKLADDAETKMNEANAQTLRAKIALANTQKKTRASELSLEAFDLTLDGDYSAAKIKADSAVILYSELENGDYETDLLYNTYYSILSRTPKSRLNQNQIGFTEASKTISESAQVNHCFHGGDAEFEVVKKLNVKPNLVYCLTYSKNGKMGAVGLKSGKVILFDPSNNKVIDSVTVGIYRVTSLGFSPNGANIVASTVDQKFAIVPLINSSGKRDHSKQILRRSTFTRVEAIEYVDQNTIKAIGGEMIEKGVKVKEFKLYPATVEKITEILK
ncbi:MAG: hypothetical protein Crog4KO_22190 [Crocinitomicaceae bacterium]